MEAWIKHGTLVLSMGVEVAAAVIIALASLQATVSALKAFFLPKEASEARYRIRLQLGRWLALSLEFLLAADILRTAVAPSWNEIGMLAAIIALRTLLNFFLEKEVERVERHHRERSIEHAI